MTDTAEYWQDVKKKSAYVGVQYSHIPDIDCGHRHLHETSIIKNINCNACKKLLTPEIIKVLNDASVKEIANKDRALMRREKKARSKRKKRIIKLNLIPCICTHSMAIRTNHMTNEQFYGCTNYPVCKHTKSIK